MTRRHQLLAACLIVLWAMAQARSFIVPVDEQLQRYIEWHSEATR